MAVEGRLIVELDGAPVFTKVLIVLVTAPERPTFFVFLRDVHRQLGECGEYRCEESQGFECRRGTGNEEGANGS
jgi:hypothetical protein